MMTMWAWIRRLWADPEHERRMRLWTQLTIDDIRDMQQRAAAIQAHRAAIEAANVARIHPKEQSTAPLWTDNEGNVRETPWGPIKEQANG